MEFLYFLTAGWPPDGRRTGFGTRKCSFLPRKMIHSGNALLESPLSNIANTPFSYLFPIHFEHPVIFHKENRSFWSLWKMEPLEPPEPGQGSKHRQQAHAAASACSKHKQQAQAASTCSKHKQQAQAASTSCKHWQQAQCSKHKQQARSLIQMVTVRVLCWDNSLTGRSLRSTTGF